MRKSYDTFCRLLLTPGMNSPLDVWATVGAKLLKMWNTSEFLMRDVLVSETDVANFVKETNAKRLTLEWDRTVVLSCGLNDICGYYSVHVTLPDVEKVSVFDEIVNAFDASTIFARVYSYDFSRWQNETYVSDYEKEGWPFDESQIYIDRRKKRRVPIDNNPGREVKHRGDSGYNEAVGSTIWIGSSFVERTGGDWRDMKQYDWCQLTKQDNGLVRLDSWPQPFDSDQGEQRERQDVLRRILFPQSADK